MIKCEERAALERPQGLSLTTSYVPDIFILLAEEKDSWKIDLSGSSSYWKKYHTELWTRGALSSGNTDL